MRRVPGSSLWLGHVGDARDLGVLIESGIEAVVDLAHEEPPLSVSRELAYCRFPLVDGPGNPPWLLRAAIETVAQQYPDRKFTLIDATSELPNVQSVVFREQEGSFLVGVLAALASQTHKLGFVGGMDIPLIRRFAAGYAAGARYADPGVEILVNMTGTTPAAWQDPARGAELARSQFDRGADIVYAAAGSTGLGVLQAAADAKKLAIGVDSNQDYLYPGTMLTSMVKRVDLAVYQAYRSAKDGTWQAGIRSLGVAEDGVGYTTDEYNAALVTPAMRAKADAARTDIIAGKIAVPNQLAP